MNKTFFTKYLAVEGEIKEGDKVKYSKGKLGFPNDIYTVLDNEKEKMSAKGIGGFGIYYCKKTYKREDGKTVEEGAYLKIGYNIDPKDIQKVKLFLCSTDIQVGDKAQRYFKDKLCNPTEVLDIQEDKVKMDGGSFTSIWDAKDLFFKVIGEISPEAKWVEEGDVFDENELGWLLWDTRFPEDGDIFYEFSNEPEIKDKYSFKVICIMGPCGHFH